MMRVYVDVRELGGRAVSLLREKLVNRAELHELIADAAEENVREHLRGLNTRSPNTNFYGKAARAVSSKSDDKEAVVTISHRGFAQRYYGGRILPKNVKHLALPTEHVPVVNFVRLAPRDAGPLAFIPRLGGPNVTAGYLVEGEEKRITRGKNKGKKRIAPKKGGKMMYVLRGWVDQDPDPTVLPSNDELTEGGVEALRDYLA